MCVATDLHVLPHLLALILAIPRLLPFHVHLLASFLLQPFSFIALSLGGFAAAALSVLNYSSY